MYVCLYRVCTIERNALNTEQLLIVEILEYGRTETFLSFCCVDEEPTDNLVGMVGG